MNRTHFTSCMRAIAGVLFVTSFAVTASAQSGSGRTVLTFSAPVRLPGITLPAGTYRFERVEAGRDARRMRVFSVKQRQLVATLRTSPASRMTGGTDVVFRQTPSGATPALGELYMGGGAAGAEFVYSGAEQLQFARHRATAAAPSVAITQ